MNEEELLQRAAEERATIVARYRHGRKEGAIIDPWEDPEIQQYQNIDRYGFIYDAHGKHFSGEGREVEEKNAAEVKIEMERVKKWLKMLKTWDDVKSTDKVRRRVFKGIPDSLRSQAWSKMLNLEYTKKVQRGKYQEMRELAWKWSPDIRQIDLDVNRTYRDHIMFRQRYNIKQQELFNVLGAYSMYNLEIGYCQGMSQIAALLLMYFDEEEAFWALSNLVSDPKYCMHGFFIPGFPKLLRYQEHHDKIMKKFLPKLKKHLDKNGVDTGIYTLKWFFQCFLDRIPFRLTLRVWDIYLFIGDRVLTAMAYNLLKLHRRKLISLGMDDILQFLQVHLERKFEIDDDLAIESLNRCLDELKRNKLDYAGVAPENELPKRPFGHFTEPPFDQRISSSRKNSLDLNQVGRRRSEFTPEERSARENTTVRMDEAIAEATVPDPPEHVESDSEDLPHHNHTPVPDSKGWLEANVDETSSLLGDGSRRSLADTSITSTADLSVARSAVESLGSDPPTPRGPSPDIPSPIPGSPDIQSPTDVLRIYVPYESPPHPYNGDLPLLPLDNRIRILVMDQTPEENTPLVEMPSPFHHSPIDLK